MLEAAVDRLCRSVAGAGPAERLPPKGINGGLSLAQPLMVTFTHIAKQPVAGDVLMSHYRVIAWQHGRRHIRYGSWNVFT